MEPKTRNRKPARASAALTPNDAQKCRRVVVTLDNACTKDPALWAKSVDQLKQAGLEVSRELDMLGMVAGTVPDARASEIAAQAHVLRVEDDERRSTQ